MIISFISVLVTFHNFWILTWADQPLGPFLIMAGGLTNHRKLQMSLASVASNIYQQMQRKPHRSPNPSFLVPDLRRTTTTSWWQTASSVRAVAKGYKQRRLKLSNYSWTCNARPCKRGGKHLGQQKIGHPRHREDTFSKVMLFDGEWVFWQSRWRSGWWWWWW